MGTIETIVVVGVLSTGFPIIPLAKLFSWLLWERGESGDKIHSLPPHNPTTYNKNEKR